MIETIKTLIETKYPEAKHDSLISLMQDVQNISGYLSKEALSAIGKELDIPLSKIYGVASFYNQFRFQPTGKYHIQLCRGTACHVKGSAQILEAVKQFLRIDVGETTKDKLFSIEVVACIGACGLAPVIVINGEYHARLTVDTVRTILQDLRRNNATNA